VADDDAVRGQVARWIGLGVLARDTGTHAEALRLARADSAAFESFCSILKARGTSGVALHRESDSRAPRPGAPPPLTQAAFASSARSRPSLLPDERKAARRLASALCIDTEEAERLFVAERARERAMR
jgi:hypothetical protein